MWEICLYVGVGVTTLALGMTAWTCTEWQWCCCTVVDAPALRSHFLPLQGRTHSCLTSPMLYRQIWAQATTCFPTTTWTTFHLEACPTHVLPWWVYRRNMRGNQGQPGPTGNSAFEAPGNYDVWMDVVMHVWMYSTSLEKVHSYVIYLTVYWWL